LLWFNQKRTERTEGRGKEKGDGREMEGKGKGKERTEGRGKEKVDGREMEGKGKVKVRVRKGG
jgi:hypothetical protein